MIEERKTLEREVARAEVTANRFATVVANEWKDGNDKVIPVKQWLEERKFFQGEMQQLRDKLAVAERTAKAEAQLKEKFLLRFKVLEERIKASNGNSCTVAEVRNTNNGPSRRQSLGGAESLSGSASNLSRKTSISRSGSIRSNSASMLLKNAKFLSRSFDGGGRSLDRERLISDAIRKDNSLADTSDQTSTSETVATYEESTNGTIEISKAQHEDYVSGMLYDLLQKEVISLTKTCHEKDQTLKDKDDAMEILAKKVDTLNKAMEVEAKNA
ncbi:Microtubule-associated protein 70 [Quillaja saponaria]|uniref:Microtubule-associated protein 70 n=1 Tax=Quillaja saponaria TaxID=32244 RepID=A0AAD7PZK8_QUISA|nr:Microtubule-associated protein 70 [Quillaja saponaria]